MKSMTLRLEDELADDLDTVAAVDGMPVVDVVRAAIAAHIERRQADPQFQMALLARIERERQMLRGGTDSGS